MSALDLIRRRVAVDIDQLSPEIAERLGPFCDMTSNQALVAAIVTNPENEEVVRRMVARARIEGSGEEEQIELALDLFAVSFAKAVLPFLNGRVHAQLSPRYAHSIPDSLAHAHRLKFLFAAEGIPPSRWCLKIPSTGAGLVAAKQLESEGIRTLATTLFSVDQALAASQAGCLYIAPYWNELSVHFEPETWRDYETPEKEHPMSEVIRKIVDVYKGIEPRPLVMPASIVTSKEALAISTLGVDHITISGAVLEALAADQYAQDFRGAALEVDVLAARVPEGGKAVHPNVDFLANGGAALDESIAADESVKRRLDYAIKAFADCEARAVEVIRSLL